MSKILADLSDPLLPEAIEVNFAAEMSEKLYRRLGFQDYCAINHFRWYPDKELENNV